MTELRAATLDLTEHILIGVLWLAGVTVGTTIRFAGTWRIERMWGPVDFNLDQVLAVELVHRVDSGP